MIAQFTEFSGIVSHIKNDSVVLDGEIVCPDGNSRSIFNGHLDQETRSTVHTPASEVHNQCRSHDPAKKEQPYFGDPTLREDELRGMGGTQSLSLKFYKARLTFLGCHTEILAATGI